MYKKYFGKHFKTQLKPLLKKIRNLINDIDNCLNSFSKHTSASLGKNFYKLRLHSSDLPKGKNKSFRIVIFLNEINKIIIPISIYLKSNKTDISFKEIDQHLEIIMDEIDKEYFI